ncbi:hydroxyethylthiazole kinase [Flavonifractor sp. An100]|uniref:hydroxyethylthiazole kinase n=1 Tax=Flavonifractor sp. An100 TaxID=1965538 RepID=UPI000B36FF3A|nr:hydroxyethylthiazole kinase [Flavonifractor sp. An100]OUQ82313.1 hydroxyethylthiazole kinase [Flavonifractor sp. An100]
MLGTCLDRVRAAAPLIHCITNYVTVNDVANALLACGASPIMADDPGEAADISKLCAGLTINIGTLNQRTLPAMELAGQTAAALDHPTVLDPVGAGASALRTQSAKRLLEQISFTAIRGNISEFHALFHGAADTQGVDASRTDAVTEENLETGISFAKEAAARFGCLVSITGAIDLVSDGQRCFVIRNGRREMSRITGTGCQLSALTAAFLAANPNRTLEAAAAAVACMGVAGEIGWSHLAPWEGNATYRNRILDAIYHMDERQLEEGANYEIR